MQEDNGWQAIATLIAKKLAGQSTETEESTLTRWINESAENEKIYGYVVDPAYKLERDSFFKEIDIEGDWQKVNQILSLKDAVKQPRFTWYKIAAAVALICITAIGFYTRRSQPQSSIDFEKQIAKISPGSPQATVKLHNGKVIALADSNNVNRVFEEANGFNLYNTNGRLSYNADGGTTNALIYNEIQVPRGGEYAVTLSDGTRVWLNSETQLKFPVKFPDHERVVDLVGEAYFEVTHDSGKPFIVNTLKGGSVQVYGTQFNVNAYDDNPRAYVTLNEGKISVRNDKNQEVMLKPDEQAILTTAISVRKVDAAQFSAWKDGLLVFDGMSLHEISKLLSRWYDVEFKFEEEHIKQYRFTADIRRYSSFRDVLKIFEKTNQIIFEIDGKTISIRDKPTTTK